jgi:hypothetical protein
MGTKRARADRAINRIITWRTRRLDAVLVLFFLL